MGVDTPTENPGTEELASLQDTLDSEQIASGETVAGAIETVGTEASTLQRYEYVLGERADS